jgi:hypothetical protein
MSSARTGDTADTSVAAAKRERQVDLRNWIIFVFALFVDGGRIAVCQNGHRDDRQPGSMCTM